MRKVLGRGLDVLLPKPAEHPAEPAPPVLEQSHKIAISLIKPNRVQPRKNFDPERLSELAQSIKENGLAQPILVSYDSVSNTYELIAGERRLRACQLAGLTTIDAVIRTPTSDKHRLALALVENIQRDNLNAIETAVSYRKLVEEYGVPQSQLSQTLGKSKSAVSNTLRLLELPEEVQKAVQFEQITEGHARALLMIPDPIERDKLFRRMLEQKLSVREAEDFARVLVSGKPLPRNGKPSQPKLKSADIKALEKHIEQNLGTKVEISSRSDGKSGRIVIHFYSLNDFEKFIKILKK